MGQKLVISLSLSRASQSVRLETGIAALQGDAHDKEMLARTAVREDGTQEVVTPADTQSSALTTVLAAHGERNTSLLEAMSNDSTREGSGPAEIAANSSSEAQSAAPQSSMVPLYKGCPSTHPNCCCREGQLRGYWYYWWQTCEQAECDTLRTSRPSYDCRRYTGASESPHGEWCEEWVPAWAVRARLGVGRALAARSNGDGSSKANVGDQDVEAKEDDQDVGDQNVEDDEANVGDPSVEGDEDDLTKKTTKPKTSAMAHEDEISES